MNFESRYTPTISSSKVSQGEPRLFLTGSRPAILLVDDEEAILLALGDILRNEGYEVHTEASPEQALLVLQNREFAAILSDQRMPGMTGLEFLAQARRIRPHATRILITGILSLDTVIDAINKGEIYRFLVKPWIHEELLMSVRNAVQRHYLVVQNASLQAQTQSDNLKLQERLQAAGRQNEQLSALYCSLERNLSDSIQLCVRALDLFLPSLGSQARRAHELCLAMADVLALSPQQRQTLEISAWLHETGLLGFPRALVRKWQRDPGTLTPSERHNIERHPILGESLARFEPPLAEVGRIIRAHHERPDGAGYPDQLAGDEIPWLGRLLAVAAFYVASSEQPARCVQTIQVESGATFDPEAVRVLLRALPRACMPRRESEVPLAGLRPGMKLARGVYASNGKLLIPEGQCLTSSSIDKVLMLHQMDPANQVFLVYC